MSVSFQCLVNYFTLLFDEKKYNNIIFPLCNSSSESKKLKLCSIRHEIRYDIHISFKFLYFINTVAYECITLCMCELVNKDKDKSLQLATRRHKRIFKVILSKQFINYYNLSKQIFDKELFIFFSLEFGCFISFFSHMYTLYLNVLIVKCN